MQVIAVLNQKGGAGKTTIAPHLARDWAAVQDDNPVTVVGIDRPTIDRDQGRLVHPDTRAAQPLRHLSDGRSCRSGETTHRSHGREAKGGVRCVACDQGHPHRRENHRGFGRLWPARSGIPHHAARELPRHGSSRNNHS
jgi:hypothetical protein